MAYDYEPLNMNDPNHPFARLGAELAAAQQQGMRRRSLADQLQGYPAPQMPQQQTRLAGMLGQPMQAQQMPMGQMLPAMQAMFGQQSKFGSGASVSAPMQSWDPNKPDAAGVQASGFGGWLQSLFGGGGPGGAAKG